MTVVTDREELINSLWVDIDLIPLDWRDILRKCLEIMTTAQIAELCGKDAEPQTVPHDVFMTVTAEIVRLLRATGKHLSDEEYQEFIRDVLSKVEHSELST